MLIANLLIFLVHQFRECNEIFKINKFLFQNLQW